MIDATGAHFRLPHQTDGLLQRVGSHEVRASVYHGAVLQDARGSEPMDDLAARNIALFFLRYSKPRL